jgi:hypothetical protein
MGGAVDAPDHGVDFGRYNPAARTLAEGWLSAHLP